MANDQVGATQDITFGNSVKAIVNDITSGIPGTQRLPQPNVLSGFASYNYVLSLYCLDAPSYNNPASSYMSGDLPPIICKSASGNPDYRFKSDTGTPYEFYINDLIINGTYAFNPEITNTSNLTLEFTVVEPYSMMGFVSVLTAAAGYANYKNYNDAVYLLLIQFRGNTESGQIINIPNTAKYIPFKFTSIKAKVNPGGATYICKGYVANTEAQKDTYMMTKEETVISGNNVQEILQSGENSLQAVLNSYLADQKKTGKVDVAEQVFITFPKIEDFAPTSNPFIKPPLVTPSKDDALFLKSLGLQKDTQYPDVVIASQDSSTLNDIGKEKLGYGPGRTGQSVPEHIGNSWDSKTNTWKQVALNGKSPDYVKMQFSQNTRIIDIINKVISLSTYGVKATASDAVDKEGFRPWWRIDMRVYHQPVTANDKKTGLKPKITVYRVHTYKAHASKMTSVNTPPPGYKQLIRQTAKVYEYIYTGLNSEVIDFDITLNNTFITLMSPDMNAQTQDKVTAEQENKTGSTTGVATTDTVNDGQDRSNLSPATSQAMRYMYWQSPYDRIGPTPGVTAQTRAVEVMHRAFLENYDMIAGNIKIAGDPYYISNSGLGNQQSVLTSQHNITADGDMDYQQSEVDFVIHFQTPVDINQATGLYTLHAKTAYEFSGLYKLTSVKSIFKNGQFTQELKAYRRPNQDDDSIGTSTLPPKSGLSSDVAKNGAK
jgi:hypothetical protein